jgi:hypothetical protein
MKISACYIFTSAMLLTPHTLVGIAIATAIPNPLIAAPLSFAMHFAGDRVPHWDFYSNTKKEDRLVGWRPLAVMADLVVGVAIGLTFTLYALWVVKNPNLSLNIFLCGIASVLPDALEGPYIFMKKEPAFLHWLTFMQKKMQFQAPLPWGIITQILVSGLSLFLILNLIR